MTGSQETDTNVSSSPPQKRDLSSVPSPSQIHKQYWDGVVKRAAATKPPKSPLPPSGAVKNQGGTPPRGGKNPPGTLSPRRGGAPMSVKVPAKGPLQGNVAKGAHNNPLFSELQHTPKGNGWKSIAKKEHDSKENSMPAKNSPQPPSRDSPQPALKSPSDKPTNPLGCVTNQVPSAPVTTSPNPAKVDTPSSSETVIDIQGVKDRVNFALNTPPNTPVTQEDSGTTPDGVKVNPEYSPSNNPFSPRPEFRRSSLARGATPGKLPLADWTSLLSNLPSETQANFTEPITPPKPAQVNSLPTGGSPQFIEVFLQTPGSERPTPRRRLRLSPEDDVTGGDDDVIVEDLASQLEGAGPHPIKSRVRLALKILLAVVVLLALGQLDAESGWIPQAERGAALLREVVPGRIWRGIDWMEESRGDTNPLYALSAMDLEHSAIVRQPDKEAAPTGEVWKGPIVPDDDFSPDSQTYSVFSSSQQPMIHLSFDEYEGPNDLNELLAEELPAFPATFIEPDPDAGDPDETAVRRSTVADVSPDTIAETYGPDLIGDVSLGSVLSDSADGLMMGLDGSTESSDGLVGVSDSLPATLDSPAVLTDASATVSDSSPDLSVYKKQLREAALLDMADLAVRSYTSAFFAALALFGVFSLTAFVGAHFHSPGGANVSAADDDVSDDDVSGDEDDVSGDMVAPELTTPMFLRQGVRMEDSVVVSPVSVRAGSPFGRYQAFVRQMIGQDTEAPQLVLTPVQRSRRLADKSRSVSGSPSHRFTISPA